MEVDGITAFMSADSLYFLFLPPLLPYFLFHFSGLRG